MTPFLVVALVVVFLSIGGVVGYHLWKTYSMVKLQRTTVLLVNNLAFRFSFTNGDVAEAKLREHAQKAIEALSAVWTWQQLVSLLDGVHVDVMPVKSWEDPSTKRIVAGLSFPSLRAVSVGYDLRSLAHEFAHIMEAGVGRLSPLKEHENWDTNGIYAALEKYEGSFQW